MTRKTRKQNILIILTCVLLSAVLTLGGCTKEKNTAQGNTTSAEENANVVVGGQSWAYVHEPETEILKLGENGKAVFKGKIYSYVQDGDFLKFTDDDGNETKVRFTKGLAGKMNLYERTEYHYAGISKPDGIIGYWAGGEEDRLSYEFTTKGTYLEDGIFPGYYSEDPENGTIKLMYNDHFEDTTIYYEVNGDKLIIDYPWPLVETQPAK